MGAGGAGKELAAMLVADGVSVQFVDDKITDDVLGISVVGNVDWLGNQQSASFIISVAHCGIRKKIWEQLRLVKSNVSMESSHSLVMLPNFFHLGVGSILMPHVRVTSDAVIGENSLIHYGCHLSHDTHIGSHCVLMHNVTITSGVTIEDEVFIGANTLISKNTTIKKGTVIPANTVI